MIGQQHQQKVKARFWLLPSWSIVFVSDGIPFDLLEKDHVKTHRLIQPET